MHQLLFKISETIFYLIENALRRANCIFDNFLKPLLWRIAYTLFTKIYQLHEKCIKINN